MATSAMFSKSLAHQLLIIKKVKNISETEPFFVEGAEPQALETNTSSLSELLKSFKLNLEVLL